MSFSLNSAANEAGRGGPTLSATSSVSTRARASGRVRAPCGPPRRDRAAITLTPERLQAVGSAPHRLLPLGGVGRRGRRVERAPRAPRSRPPRPGRPPCTLSRWSAASKPSVSPGWVITLQTYARTPRRRAIASHQLGHREVRQHAGEQAARARAAPGRRSRSPSSAGGWAIGCGLQPDAPARPRRPAVIALSPHTRLPSARSAQRLICCERRGQHAAADLQDAAALLDRQVEVAGDLGERRQEEVPERVPGQRRRPRSGAGRGAPSATRPRPAPPGSCGCRRAAARPARAAGAPTSRRRRPP